MIRFEHVNKSYGTSLILNDLNFKIKTGEFTVLIGPSGCGKTTTLKTINRLIEPEQGKIFIDDQDISKINKVKLRRSIGYVIQQIGLFPNMTVEENISVVPKLLKYDKKRTRKIVKEMMELGEMPYDKYAHKYPSELSGGQQQRIGVLRALAGSPPIVLMDEPFGALDPMTRSALQDEISKLQSHLNKTIVFVTHDMDEALTLADKIIFMDKGQVLQMGTPEEMLEKPANNLVRTFLGKNTLDNGQNPETVADVMRSNPITVYINRGIRESIQLMARRNIDTLLVKNLDGTYAGIVPIQDIKKHGKGHKTIEPLVKSNVPTTYIDEDAHENFEMLSSNKEDYIVVLNRDNTIAGIITNTSIAKALAKTVWGDENNG